MTQTPCVGELIINSSQSDNDNTKSTNRIIIAYLVYLIRSSLPCLQWNCNAEVTELKSHSHMKEMSEENHLIEIIVISPI